MFGEKGIYGKSIIHVDDKNRIIMPKYTGAEAGDKLLIVKCDGYLALHRVEEFEEIIKQKEKELSEKELLEFFSSILKQSECDKQLRIPLGDAVECKAELECIGARKYLILKPRKK